jgi:putative membrane protein
MLRHALACMAAAVLIADLGGCNRNKRSKPNAATYPTAETDLYGAPAPAPDVAFLQDAEMSSLAEVELSDIALHQAEAEPVRRFARTMVDDHTAMNGEIAELARSMNVVVPTQPDTRHRSAAQRLQELPREQFDREYLRLMVDDHEAMVAKFQMKAASAQDPRVRDLAARTLPTLQHHLEMAQALSQYVESPGARSGETDPATLPAPLSHLPDPTDQPTQKIPEPTPTTPAHPEQPIPPAPETPPPPPDTPPTTPR